VQDFKTEGPYISFMNRHSLFQTWSFFVKPYDFMEQDRFLPDERDDTLKVVLKQDNIP
jgi:hypothetical protein